MLLNSGVGESLDCKEIHSVYLKGNQSWNIHWEEWCWSWNSNTLATWCEDLTHLKRPWFWERLKAGREGDDRAWDGWMASQTQWTWVWVNSWSWWWTGRLGLLQSMGSQRVEHNWVPELKWTFTERMSHYFVNLLSPVFLSLKKKKTFKDDTKSPLQNYSHRDIVVWNHIA